MKSTPLLTVSAPAYDRTLRHWRVKVTQHSSWPPTFLTDGTQRRGALAGVFHFHSRALARDFARMLRAWSKEQE